VAAISVGGQQHGMVVLDAKGRVIRPALLWNDTRSSGAASALIDEVGAAEFARRSGSVPVASFTLTKLRWLAEASRRMPQSGGRRAARMTGSPGGCAVSGRRTHDWTSS